ncbi:DUF3000 domain-containing protein [Kocuria tytonis]|uniref:DUF3000 domain-containing protein n=1 Tax=Kocuria tytonis TaxID=2054280 RepID=UPI001F31E9B1|nr:DUF3000 domain-containing protein [Kocuria tytonis]
MTELNSTPEAFRAVVRSLEGARFRPEVTLSRITPPRGLAPHAISFAAEVGHARHGDTAPADAAPAREAPASGRFVVLYDESCPQPWQGPFRIVSWFRSRMDTEMGRDDLLTDVSWSWLTDTLEEHGARFTAEGGTASRTVERHYGSLADRVDVARVEVRASWTPVPLGGAPHWAPTHVRAWADVLCAAAGLPPQHEGAACV